MPESLKRLYDFLLRDPRIEKYRYPLVAVTVLAAIFIAIVLWPITIGLVIYSIYRALNPLATPPSPEKLLTQSDLSVEFTITPIKRGMFSKNAFQLMVRSNFHPEAVAKIQELGLKDKIICKAYDLRSQRNLGMVAAAFNEHVADDAFESSLGLLLKNPETDFIVETYQEADAIRQQIKAALLNVKSQLDVTRNLAPNRPEIERFDL